MEMGLSIVTVIIATIIIVCLFLLFRHVVLWYWKINKIANTQDEILTELKKIAAAYVKPSAITKSSNNQKAEDYQGEN